MLADVLPLSDIKDFNISLVQRVNASHLNWTLIELSSPVEAAAVVKLVLHPNFTAHHAHWTSGKLAASRPPEFHSTSCSPDLLITQNKGKEIENFYQKLKRSPKERHMLQTHGNLIKIF